jgi:hypothetical protein
MASGGHWGMVMSSDAAVFKNFEVFVPFFLETLPVAVFIITFPL